MDVAEAKPWQHQNPWKGDENTNLGNVGPIARIRATNHARTLYPPNGLVKHYSLLFVNLAQVYMLHSIAAWRNQHAHLKNGIKRL
jgi:hypothetical protein